MIELYFSEGKVGLKSDKGEILTQPLFDKIEPFFEGASLYVGYVDRHPFIIRGNDGGVIDLFKLSELNIKTGIERVMNWILPGLQLFYRDTDTPIDVNETYRVGDILRAGFYIDMSPYAGKPMHRYRYIIASSHAASLMAPGDRYPLHVLHYNSYLKVMDIYDKCDVTQIFLLHIPAKAIFSPFVGNSLLDITFNGELNLVDIARQSLDSKMDLPPRELLEEEEWLDRTAWHLGVDNNNQKNSLFPKVIGLQAEVTAMGKAIRKMSNDTDDINLILESYE